MTDATWGQLILLATTIGGFVVQAWRENRNRNWAQQDRIQSALAATAERDAATKEIITKAAAEAEATRIKTESVAESLRIVGLQTAAKLREDSRIAAETLRLDTEKALAVNREIALRDAAALRESQMRDAAVMVKEIQEAKGAAHSAYQEANHVNNKIEALNQRLIEVATPAAVDTKQLAQVVTNTKDTVEALHEIKRQADEK